MRNRFSMLLACLLTFGSAGRVLAQGTAETRRVFEIQEGGKVRGFDLALDELESKEAQGAKKGRTARQAKNLGEMCQLAREAEAAAGGGAHDLILYEAGKPRTEATRRVLTRQVLLRVGEGFDASLALKAVGGLKVEKPTFAPGYVLLTVRGAGEALTQLDALRRMPGVLAAEPQLARIRPRRLVPNDTYFSYLAGNPGYQWHLRNTGQSPGVAGIDANVTSVWDSYQGNGIRIGIVDDGMEVAHADLAPNADTVNDHDWNDLTPNDPTGNPSSDTHGTACAGVAGARGNNGAGVSGAAPQATLVGLRLIAGSVSDAQEAEAITWRNDIIHLYSNSWGPADDGSDLNDAGPLVKAALQNAATTGRGGKGNIWLWAGGNGGSAQDNSNYDGYANSIYTIAVGALNDSGVRSTYSEPGANILVTAPSNDSAVGHRGITTTTTNGAYTHSFGGTSSATPLAAGAVALLLQSRPELGWRDVKEILIRSASKVNPTHTGWVNNAAGFHFNHDYGAGMVNAQAAVNQTATWTNLGPMTTQQQAQTGLSVAIPDGIAGGTTRTFTIPGSVLMRVEHATVHVAATHGRRGDLNITLTSPSGMTSTLFSAHAADSNLNMDWTFSSVRHWGENAAGNWLVNVSDSVVGSPGTLTGVTLTLFGTNIAQPTAAPAITSSLSASGNVESAISYQIAASQNPQSFSASGLPTGLTVSSSGLISGVPVAAGSYNITLGATNSLGTGTAVLVLNVGPRIPTPPVLISALTAQAVLNVPFNYQISATNSPTSFTATGLPAGLGVHSGSGAISGTPSVAGTFNITISASNADGTDSKTLVLTVSSVASALAQALDAPQLVFTTGGNVPWITPATSTHDLIDAAESGNIADNEQSWLETTVTGPAFISFWFRLSSEAGYDFFRFSIDNEVLWYSDGEHAWRRLGFFVPAGIHTVRWNYTKDDLYDGGSDRLWVDQVAVDSEQAFLGAVLDNPNLTWGMPGSGSWIMQDRRTVDGVDALISPFFLDDGRSSVIETRVLGPGTVSFAWTVFSEPNADFFRFEIDNTVQDQISGYDNTNPQGNTFWATRTHSIPAGEHALRWRYIKNETNSVGLDAAWLDNIQYTPNLASGPPYSQWIGNSFSSQQQGNALLTGPEIDFDGDGRTNLEEYAFGGSPLVHDFANPLSNQPQGTEMWFQYSIETSKTDVVLTPRLSSDLSIWTDSVGEFVTQTGGRNHYRVRVPWTEGRKFLMLRATLTP
ncbi:MAG: S8 family serine peptidase [Verrucomicrobiaceae bacterium]|nr:S8 family serine peptidase [Verrucomicrobiaceae bacterium]